MNHDQVRDWIDDAFATPGARVVDDAAANDEGAAKQVQRHLADCADCASYYEATRRAILKLDLVRGPSPDVRAQLMASARRTKAGRGRSAAGPAPQPWWQRPMAWRLAAAALLLAVVGAAGGAWLAGANAPLDNDSEHLSEAVAVMTTLAADHANQEVPLRDAAGNSAGIAVISAASHQMAVFATHMSSTGEHHCYLERAGVRTWVGTMYAMPGLEFWAGDMDATITVQPGDVLVVAAADDQPALLSAAL